MKKTLFTIAVASLFFACEPLPEVDSSLTEVSAANQIAYLMTANTAEVKVKDDEGSLNDTEIKVRVANPMSSDSYYRVSVDKALIEAYNEKNNVDYDALPSSNYELKYVDAQGETKIGESIEVFIPKGQVTSGGKLTLKIKPMKDDEGNYLPVSNNYALPIKMTPKDPATKVQLGGGESIFFMQRSFKTKVGYFRGDAFHMIYGKDTGAQVSGKVYAGDKKLEEWTMQYSFTVKVPHNNWGLMYDNPRNSTSSLFWNTVGTDKKFMLRYGPSIAMNFNTPEGEKFLFAFAENNHPAAETWNHVAMVYRKVEGRPYLKIYVNGKLMFDSPSPIVAEDFPLVCFGNGSADGYVREMRLWSKALTQGQIIATQYAAKPDAEGLELYVPLNEVPYEEVEIDGRIVRRVKNKATNPNRLLQEDWYINHNGTRYRYPFVNFNTEVEF